MKYYRLVEFNPTGWDDTRFIVETLRGCHYNTLISDAGTYRKFAAFLNQEELTLATLTLGSNIEITEMVPTLITHLTSLGYLNKNKV